MKAKKKIKNKKEYLLFCFEFLIFCKKKVLTNNECNQILKDICYSKVYSHAFKPMNLTYSANIRTNSRLLTIDSNLSELLKNRLNNIINNHIIKNDKINFKIMPLGFNVLKSDWIFESINDGIRINKYEQSQFFNPHIDSQFCPSGFVFFFHLTFLRTYFVLILYPYFVFFFKYCAISQLLFFFVCAFCHWEQIEYT